MNEAHDGDRRCERTRQAGDGAPAPDRTVSPLGEAGVPLWKERPLRFRIARRAIDLLLAVPLFIVTLPIQMIIALLIRLDSPGPAIFTQERLTLNQTAFNLRKFRTMFVDAKERYPALFNYSRIVDANGRLPMKCDADPRLTRVGRWLRRTSLDELPNLWNVIRGEMSMVGPRPEIPELLGCYSEEQLQIFRVKPGVTGLPQTSGRNRLSVAETVAFDLHYARRISLALDMVIIFRTIRRVVACRDAY